MIIVVIELQHQSCYCYSETCVHVFHIKLSNCDDVFEHEKFQHRVLAWDTDIKRMRLSKNLDALILNWMCQYELMK